MLWYIYKHNMTLSTIFSNQNKTGVCSASNKIISAKNKIIMHSNYSKYFDMPSIDLTLADMETPIHQAMACYDDNGNFGMGGLKVCVANKLQNSFLCD